MDNNPAPVLLSLPRMARQLGVTQKWLREEADAGRVPSLVAGNRHLFSPPAVTAALAKRAAATTDAATPPKCEQAAR